MSRTRKSAWSFATSVLFSAVWVATGFLATPWLLRWLGSERFGIYKVLLDWMSYLTLFELGVTGALMAGLAPRVASGDAPSVRSMLASGLRTYIWVILAMLVVGAGLVLALPHVVSLQTVSSYELRLAGIISLFAAILAPMSVFRSLAETRQKHYLFNLMMAMQAIFMTLLWLAAAKAGWGLPGQSLAFVVAQIPAALVLLWDASKAYGSIWSASPDPSAKKTLRALNRPTLIHSITERITLVSDNVMVGWILGPLVVVPFYLTLRLMTLAQMQLQSLNHSTWAALAELHSHGKNKLVSVRLLEITRTIGGLGIAVLGPIAAFNGQLIGEWVGPTNFAGDTVTIVACVNTWLWSIYSSWIWPLFGTGNIGRWAPYAVMFTILKVAVSVALTYTSGVLGPLLGTLFGFLFLDSWVLPRILHQTFDLSPWTLWKSALSPLTWGLPYAATVWFIARSHAPFGLFVLILEIAAAMLGGLILYWTLSLDKDARGEWRSRFKLAMSSY
jgi:O-antigen/teichoic acid export membrane protein